MHHDVHAGDDEDVDEPVTLPAEPLEDHVERVSTIPPVDVPKPTEDDAGE